MDESQKFVSFSNYTSYVYHCLDVCNKFPPREKSYNYFELENFMKSQHVLEVLNYKMLNSLSQVQVQTLMQSKINLRIFLNQEAENLTEKEFKKVQFALKYLKGVREYTQSEFLPSPPTDLFQEEFKEKPEKNFNLTKE